MNEECNFKEDNTLILTKLVIYFLLNAVGVATALYGYLVKPFERTRFLVAVGSAVYLLFTGIWTVLLQYRVVGTLYRGRDQAAQGKAIWLRSAMKYPQAVYQIEVLKPGTAMVVGKPLEIGVGEWVDVDGTVRADLLVQCLKEKLLPKFKLE